MKKWNEVNAETLKDIIQQFIYFKDWTQDKVIEIQCPMNIINGVKNNRFYFCNRLNWRKYLHRPGLVEPFLESIETIAKKQKSSLKKEELHKIMDSMLSNGDVIYYINLVDSKPTIMPITFNDNLTKNILLDASLMDNMFEKSMKYFPFDSDDLKWYLKDKDKRIIDTSESSYLNYKPTEKYYRIRSIEYNEWENLIEKVLSGGELDACEDDFSWRDLKIK